MPMARRRNPDERTNDDLRANLGVLGVLVLVVAIIALLVLAFQMQRAQQASLKARAQAPASPSSPVATPPAPQPSPSSRSSSSPVASPSSTPSTGTPVAAFLGDSYSLGQGGGGTNWTTLVAAAAGWKEANLARGGTGYTKGSSGATCDLSYCPSYQEMIPAVAAAHPAVVVVSGGRNDGASYDRAAIKSFYSSLRAAVPQARIVAISPLWDAQPVPGWLGVLAGDVRYSVAIVGGEYADIGQPLLDHPELVAAGGVYPNAEGYKAIAAAVRTSLGVG